MVPDALADLVRLEGVPSAVGAAVAAVDAVLRDRGRRVISPEVRAAALAVSAEATTELSGDRPRWLVGALRLSAELDDLASLVKVAPAQALARTHAIAARGVVDDRDLGRVVDRPGVSERMRDLCELLTSPTQASAVVLAAVVHAEIATVAPFVDGNGLVARAAEHLVLIAGGIDPRGVIVVEAGHGGDATAYATALNGYAEGGAVGVRDWLLHCARSLARAAELSPR